MSVSSLSKFTVPWQVTQSVAFQAQGLLMPKIKISLPREF